MKIQRSTMDHVEPWARLRAALWPDHSVQHHRDDVVRTFLAGDGRAVAFICETNEGEVIGFAEATLRRDYVNGCKTSPVLFLEGIYVLPGHRQTGAARLLCDAIAGWGRSAGCTEFASDALLDNVVSHKFHAALGFEETRRVVFFRKSL
ncbi:aminoglycoside 6'-N-acetyltransferase [Inquilinus sp. Marseille-Q2685]|uniref:aminoglycoside 6'-N-acetyltransferase n=1 Tax=Inquilinus sp. Marseille-Q2685 TaxID=2866581 RepID=UPI001CE3DF4E|nr:aminoglycoside 6'-N-acetyltransferase [Inquilinus sp. Marseille-Q2685]